MPVPDFQSLMKPVLEAHSDGAATRVSEARERVAASKALVPGDLQEMLPSGLQSVFVNRVGWAVTHMERAGLLERVRRGTYRLTEDGGKLLAQAPVRIDMKTLYAIPVYAEWRGRVRESPPGKGAVPVQAEELTDTPEEALEHAARQLRVELEVEVLKRVLEAPPAFLERVVVELLIAMGTAAVMPLWGMSRGARAMAESTERSGKTLLVWMRSTSRRRSTPKAPSEKACGSPSPACLAASRCRRCPRALRNRISQALTCASKNS